MHVRLVFLSSVFLCVSAAGTDAAEPESVTTLAGNTIEYTVPASGYHILEAGGVRAVIVDNRAVDDEALSDHKAGYSGVAALTHSDQPKNLFVPSYAGLNFEHIHDGTTRKRDILFEPRRDPMELRVIDDNTVDLYQAPTSTWQLESVSRYEMLADGTIELTVECIPRAATFKNGYIGLFWASYIHQPESLDIHFRGHSEDDKTIRWIRGVTPKHGVLSTHLGIDDKRVFQHDSDFPLTLAFNRSQHRYEQPWYFGVSNNMALVLMFRPQDQIRITQSPSGGGAGNPAWDFQYFIDDYQVGKLYQMVMRAKYLPYQSPQQVEAATAKHRAELGQ